jgi:hypothetical protein
MRGASDDRRFGNRQRVAQETGKPWLPVPISEAFSAVLITAVG